MTWIDCTIIIVISFSCLISLIRGFISEMLSIITWGCAFFITNRYYTHLSVWFTGFKDEFIRNGISISILFITTLIFGIIINFTISQLVRRVGLSGIDRILGLFFGAIRGVLIVSAVLFLLGTLTDISRDENWKKSYLIPYFSFIIRLVFNYLQNSSALLSRV